MGIDRSDPVPARLVVRPRRCSELPRSLACNLTGRLETCVAPDRERSTECRARTTSSREVERAPNGISAATTSRWPVVVSAMSAAYSSGSRHPLACPWPRSGRRIALKGDHRLRESVRLDLVGDAARQREGTADCSAPRRSPPGDRPRRRTSHSRAPDVRGHWRRPIAT